MALPAVPDWLSQRDGTLKAGIRDHTLFVVLAGQPQYRLDVRPAKGKSTCQVIQMNNGRRLDGGNEYPDPAAAFAGGLAELRDSLGW
jgi:hypothetical protein